MYATVDKNGHFTGVVYSEMTKVVQDWHEAMGFTWVVVEKRPEPIGEDDFGRKKYGKPTTEEKLAFAKQAKVNEINTAFQEADLNPVVVGGHAYKGGFESGLAIDAQRRAMLEYSAVNPLAGITTVDFFDVEGIKVTLPLSSEDQIDALDVCLALHQSASANAFKCAQLVAAVHAATTLSDVEAIRW